MMKQSPRFIDELFEWCDRKSLVVTNQGVTRSRWVQNTLQESSLDILISNSDNFKLGKEHTTLSDHYIIKLTCRNFKVEVLRHKTYIEVTNWKFDRTIAANFLEKSLQTLPKLTKESVKEFDYGIRASLTKTLIKFARSRKLTVHRQNEVTSVKIVRLKNRRDKLRKKWGKEKTALNYVELVRATRDLRREVRRVRKGVIKSKMSKSPKDFWNEVKILRGIQNNEVEHLMVEGVRMEDRKKISNVFAEFFTGKVDKILNDYIPSEPDGLKEITDFEPFTEVDIGSAIDRLSNKKSAGMDCLSGFYVKMFKHILVPYLKDLFNLIQTKGEIPPTWKIAKIIPIHKKGNTNNVENFRPVSNISSIAKIFELCVLQRLEALDQDHLLGNFQHGFRKKHSTTSAIAELINNISESIENNKKVAVYSADLTAAFDLLRKEKLVEI